MKSLKLLSISAVTALAVASQAVVINEIQPNPPGSDPTTQSLELKGNVGDSFSGFLLSLESDASSSAGLADRISQVSGTFDSNGLITVDIPDLENPSFTLVLVDNFTGDNNTDFDADDDGNVDLNLAGVGISTVYDSIGVPDTTGEPLYGASFGFSDFAYAGNGEPVNIFRDSVTDAWYSVSATGIINDLAGNAVDAGSFNQDPTVTTFGDVNPTTAVPEPATMVLLGLGAAALANKKRCK